MFYLLIVPAVVAINIKNNKCHLHLMLVDRVYISGLRFNKREESKNSEPKVSARNSSKPTERP
jgi:hypothetical protein